MAKILAANIRDARTRQSLNQSDLAEKSGVSLRAISDLEAGKHIPRKGNLNAIREALGMSDEDLFRDPAAAPPAPSISLDEIKKAVREAAQDVAGPALTAEELDLLRLFRSLSSDRRRMVLADVRHLAERDEPKQSGVRKRNG